MSKTVVLAFSGGLDTSWCVPWLEEHLDAQVVTVTIDVGGFDFSHPDFRADTKSRRRTRFERIWDQGAQSGRAPDPFGYGREILRKDMDRALDGAPQIGVEPTDIVRQSVQQRGSHGTHVGPAVTLTFEAIAKGDLARSGKRRCRVVDRALLGSCGNIGGESGLI